MASPLSEKALEIAHSRIGVREIGASNTGPEVNRFLASVGVAPGNPWCAALVYANYMDAAKALGVGSPLPRTGYCPDIGQFARTRHILFDTPQRGDSFLQIHGDDFHHTGHVTGADGDEFSTIEGNTNSSGAREGVDVEAKQRTNGPRFKFVRWDLLIAPATLTRALILTDHKVTDMSVVNNISICPVRRFCQWFGLNLVWDNSEEPPVVINGQRLAGEVSLIDGEAFAPIRALVATVPGLKVSFDAAKNQVVVSK